MKPLNVVITLAAAALTAAGCSSVHGEAPKAARPVKAQAVTLSTPSVAVRYSAAIEPFEQVPLAFKASGYVDDVRRQAGADGRMRNAQPGDLVSKGAVLARVRESEYRERVNQSRSRIGESEAALAKANLDLNRARTLIASASLTRPELDAAQAAYDTAVARLAGVRAELELAETALRDCALVSPATGILLERKIEVGSLVSAGTVGFVVADISAVKAHFGIPDSMIQSVTPGERIDLIVESVAGATFQGRVTAVAPAADAQSRVFDVEVTIPNPDRRLRPGMIGSVSVRPADARAAAASRSVPTVPLTAIVKPSGDGASYAAFTVERRGETEVARLRAVELGDVAGNAIEVLKGLTAGERVIVTGATLLVDGEEIRVIP